MSERDASLSMGHFCCLISSEMPDRSIGTSTVAYGIERMNRKVSEWMRGSSDAEDSPDMPFIATKGCDSVVWSRMYSRDTSELDDYQINQASVMQQQQ